MSDIIEFPGEFITPEQRERGRWINIGFLAAVLPGTERQYWQIFFNRLLETTFADVRDDAPYDDPAAAVKRLLKTLANPDDPIRKKASEDTFERMFNDANKGKFPDGAGS
jgi:hypothetical protein